ncbi:MAG: ABC transporter permease [Clostridia bacterium]|nr:ABC transporter permease [Clostridia bacterium]
MRLPSPEVALVDKKDIRSLLRNNAVTVMFVVLCTLCMIFSGQSVSYVIYELFGRLSRNSFIVLALIIPIVAGMGINFAITIGAMAAQISVLWVIEWGVGGIGGFLLAMGMTLPIAALFGFLIGKLLNKMKGQEMIGGLILGYFASGLYQLLFLFIFGNLIPLNTPGLVVKGSTGVANTIDLNSGAGGGIKYALDGIWRTDFGTTLYVLCGIVAMALIVGLLLKKVEKKKAIIGVGTAAVLCGLYQIPAVADLFSMVKVPMITFIVVGILCLFNVGVMKTRLGQQFRAVGQNRTVANASGIHVDKVRLIAIVISTVLAGWGQLIFVQNMGSFQTYGAHEQVGLYAGAAILVGGASIRKATNGQAILGCILFHLLFIVAPPAAKNLFGDAAIGEYFRVFISYGVIAMALVMHAWRGVQARKEKKEQQEAAAK